MIIEQYKDARMIFDNKNRSDFYVASVHTMGGETEFICAHDGATEDAFKEHLIREYPRKEMALRQYRTIPGGVYGPMLDCKTLAFKIDNIPHWIASQNREWTSEVWK